MKVKTKALLKAENEYLKTTLLFYIKAIKEAGIPFESEIQYAHTSFTEYHKTRVGNIGLTYNLEKLYDLKDKSIAYEINEVIKR